MMDWFVNRIFKDVWVEVEKELNKIRASQRSTDLLVNTMSSEFGGYRNSLVSTNKAIVQSQDDMNVVVDNKLDLLRGELDDKVVGMYRTIDEKVAQGNGNTRVVADLLRKIAKLQDVKDSIETRRSTEMVLDRIAQHKKLMLEEEKNDVNNLQRRSDIIKTLEWVLGENNE